MLGTDLEDSVKRQMLDKVRTNASAFPVLAQISSLFARNAADVVRDYLGTLTETVGSNFSVKRYGAFIDNTPMPAMIGVLSAAGVGDSAAISLDNRFVNIITDLAMGGDMPDIDSLEGRSPTSLDCAIAKILVDRLLEMFDQVMVGACGQSIGLMECERFEHVPILIDIAPERSELISFQVALEIGEVAEAGSFELVLPIQLLEPVRAQLQHSSAPLTDTERERWTQHMSKVVTDTGLPLDGELVRMRAPLGLLVNMKPGDILPLSDTTLDDVSLTITTKAGVQKVASGRLGAAKGMKALKLNGPFDAQFMQTFEQVVSNQSAPDDA